MPETNTIVIEINIEMGAWNMSADTNDPARRAQLVAIAIDLLTEYANSLEALHVDN